MLVNTFMSVIMQWDYKMLEGFAYGYTEANYLEVKYIDPT